MRLSTQNEALAALEKLATALRDIRDDFSGDIEKCEEDWAKTLQPKAIDGAAGLR